MIFLFVGITLVIGAIAAYNDLRTGKVPNQLIFFGLFAGLFLMLVSFLSNILPASLILKGLINALVSLGLGYVFWYFDLWGAGDAKLFFVLALLLPLEFYWRSFLPVWPAIVILINAFIPLLVFVFCQSVFFVGQRVFLFFREGNFLVRLENNTKKASLYLKNNWLGYLEKAGGFCLVFIIFQTIRLETSGFTSGFNWGRSGLFFLMVFLGMAVNRIIKNKKAIIAMAIILALYLFGRWFFYSNDLFINILLATKSSGFYLVGFGLVSWLFSFYEKAGQKDNQSKNLHFALWLLVGVVLTLILKGSLLIIQ